MTLLGGVILPALDALSRNLKNTIPSFKKKKGAAALPAEIGEVQVTIWNAAKNSLKSLQTAIDTQAQSVEAALREKFQEAEVLAVSDCVELPQGCSDEDRESLR